MFGTTVQVHRDNPSTRKGLGMWKMILQRVAVTTLALVATFGGIAITAQPAAAAVSNTVDFNQACNHQYPNRGAFALYWNPYNAYTWFCARSSGAGIPPSVSFEYLGGLDLGAYCNWAYPGTFPTIVAGRTPVEPAVWRWRCWRR